MLAEKIGVVLSEAHLAADCRASQPDASKHASHLRRQVAVTQSRFAAPGFDPPVLVRQP
jgi:hypothetical protein